MEPIGIINYGYGNIFSVINSLDYLDIKYKIIDKPEHINEFHNVILPGVGSFGNVMRKLNELNFNNALKEYVQIDKNLLLGICVGMQVLFNESEESENIKGLDLLEGSVKKLKKIEDNYIDRIPNIGWRNNYVEVENKFLLDNLQNKKTYFIHSYYCEPNKKYKNVSYILRNKQKIVSSIFEKNIVGIQFHAERSKSQGLQLIKEIFSNWRNHYYS